MASNGKWQNPHSIDVNQSVGSAFQSLTSYLGGSQPWTPTLASTGGTQPALGTASKVEGEVIRTGNQVYAAGLIVFGTSSVNAGTGTYLLGVPYTPKTWVNSYRKVIGSGFLFDNSAGIMTLVQVQVNPDGTVVMGRSATTSYDIAASTPWVWNTDDQIDFELRYTCIDNAVFTG